MSTFVCIHGAGGRATYWDPVRAELEAMGHEVIAMDLPCEHEVGLDAYVDAVVDAVDAHRRPGGGAEGPPIERNGDIVLVAHSLGGFVAPLVCDRLPVAHIVLLAAMVPRPGESGGEWWEVTGHAAAVAAQGLPDDSPETLFVHDVPLETLVAVGEPRGQTSTLFEEPWPLDRWPGVPTSFVLFGDDRFFPAGWLRRIVEERLGIDPTEVPGGHAAHLSRPADVAAAIVAAVDHPPHARAVTSFDSANP